MFSDVYHAPEKHDLEIIGTVTWISEPWEFDMSVVWRRISDGKLFFRSDRGCSCRVPFQDVGVAQLTEITSLGEIQTVLTNTAEKKAESSRYRKAAGQDIVAIIEKLHQSGYR